MEVILNKFNQELMPSFGDKSPRYTTKGADT
jgi:hypothetical protein